MKVECKIEVYPNDKMDSDYTEAKIISHWNRDNAFGLIIDGKEYWFDAGEFLKSVRNACNH